MIDYRELVGTKYKVHGRSIEEGFDCWGLVLYVYKSMGIQLLDPCYENLKDRLKVNQELINSGMFIKIERFENNCIIEILDRGEPVHVGLYIGNGMMIHCTSRNGVICEPVNRYKKNIVGLYKVGSN